MGAAAAAVATGAVIAVAVIATAGSAPTLTGAWVDPTGSAFTFAAAGLGIYVAREESPGAPQCAASDDVKVDGGNGRYEGTIDIYRQGGAGNANGCEPRIGIDTITIDIAANGASAYVTIDGTASCTDCAPQTWTRQGT
jgi:hypothetical protein